MNPEHLSYFFIFSGNLWEELRKDSLVSDPQVTTTTLSSASALQEVENSYMQVSPPFTGRRKSCEYEDEDKDENTDRGQNFEQNGCLNGLHPVVYSGVESLAGYLTSCTTSISLM